MQSQLALVTEVQVAFLTLKKGSTATFRHCSFKYVKRKVEVNVISCIASDIFIQLCVNIHGRAFPLCVYAGGSSTSAGDGSVFHRSRMDTASPPCGSAREHGDERPAKEKKKKKHINSLKQLDELRRSFRPNYYGNWEMSH